MQAGDAKQAQIDGAAALVDASSGLALYTFDGDTVADQSTRTGGCLTVWPAHAASSSETASGNFTIFTRSDGSLQWAYKGKPLYTFASDTASSNGTGDGIQGFTSPVRSGGLAAAALREGAPPHGGRF